MKTVLAAALAAAALSAAGCGSRKKGTVEGEVTVGGNPLAQQGVLTFVGVEDDQGTFNAGIVDGRYKTPPMPAGTYRVTVVAAGNLAAGAAAPPPADDAAPAGGDAAPAPVPAPGAGGRLLVLDSKYASTESSGLEVTVGPGANEWNIPLDTVWK